MLIEDTGLQWCEDRHIAELDKEFVGWMRNEEAARRLPTMPGIGVLKATALIAAIPSRQLCAWAVLRPQNRPSANHSKGIRAIQRVEHEPVDGRPQFFWRSSIL